MRKLIRVCALLLTLCMVLALLPVNAFAATKIAAVTVLDLDAPALNAVPDDTVAISSTPANGISVAEVTWFIYDKTTGDSEMVPDGYTFGVGDEVYARVLLWAEEGYTFGEKDTTYTGAINMINLDQEYGGVILESNLLCLFTVDFAVITETDGEQITAITVSDLDAPVVGEKPDFAATVTTQPADAVAASEVLWVIYDEATDGALSLGAEHTFAEGELVAALLHVEPKEGYSFGTPLETYAGTVTTPYGEEKVLHEVEADGSMYIYIGEWTLEAESVVEFVDVPEGEWYTDAVRWAVKNGVTTGVDETHFAPDEGCTRAQAVTFLWRAAGKPEPTVTECAFEDVDVTQYYYKAVLWAVENGITNGTDATHFEPDTVCTRAHIVTFLYRTLKGTVGEAATNPFEDVPVGEWYTDAVLWAAENGVTTGTDATHFEPESTCIRSQIVTFIYRAMAK